MELEEWVNKREVSEILSISQDGMEKFGVYLCSELCLSSRNYPGEVTSPLGASKSALALMFLVKLFSRMHQYADFMCVFGAVAKNAL